MIRLAFQSKRPEAWALSSVRNFKDGAMTLRYAAAGFLEAERGFRRLKGYKQIPFLQNALARLTESGGWATLESA